MQQTFGKYKLHRRLAFGGMAEVFLGSVHGEAGFSKVVVIKRLHPRLSNDHEFVQMLIDEARITSLLTHSNICQVLDLGSVGGSYYIAMEYIAGEDLRTLLDYYARRGLFMPVEAALFTVAELLAGLEYAHAKEGVDGPLGVIHRDISPQNVLVSYEGEVKVIDFGIAKARSRMVQTQAGVIKGKFRYMSPEQASGFDIDHRTDVFAAGVVLYELLRGRPHSQDVPDTEVLRRMRAAEFEPINRSREEVSDDILELLARALKRKARKRFGSAGEFRQGILEYMRGAGMMFGRTELGTLMKGIFPAERRRERSGLSSSRELRDPSAARPDPFAPPDGTQMLAEEGDSASEVGPAVPDQSQAAFAETRAFDATGQNVREHSARGLSRVPTEPVDENQPTSPQQSLTDPRAVTGRGNKASGTRDLSLADVRFQPESDAIATVARPHHDDGKRTLARESESEVRRTIARPPSDTDARRTIARQPDSEVKQTIERSPHSDAKRTIARSAERPPASPQPARYPTEPGAEAAGVDSGYWGDDTGQSQEHSAHQEARPDAEDSSRASRGGLEQRAGVWSRSSRGPVAPGRKQEHRPEPTHRSAAESPAPHEQRPAEVSRTQHVHRGGSGSSVLIAIVLFLGLAGGAFYYGYGLWQDDSSSTSKKRSPVDARARVVSAPDGGATRRRARRRSRVRVKSRPAGARITLCGNDTGRKTPATLRMPPGRRCTLLLEMPGHEPYRASVRGRRGRTLNVSATLKKVQKTVQQGRGELTVTSIQVGTVYINGRRLGQTPHFSLSLLPGRYKVKVVFSGLGVTAKPRTITVRAGRTLKLHFDPSP